MSIQRIKTVTLHRIEEQKACPICGRVFWGNKKAKFDRRQCRDRDYYIRKGVRQRELDSQETSP